MGAKSDCKLEPGFTLENYRNAAANRVGTVNGTKMQLRTGKLNYLSFERNIEKITFNGNLAFVMGEEKIVPQGAQDNAGKLVIWQA